MPPGTLSRAQYHCKNTPTPKQYAFVRHIATKLLGLQMCHGAPRRRPIRQAHVAQARFGSKPRTGHWLWYEVAQTALSLSQTVSVRATASALLAWQGTQHRAGRCAAVAVSLLQWLERRPVCRAAGAARKGARVWCWQSLRRGTAWPRVHMKWGMGEQQLIFVSCRYRPLANWSVLCGWPGLQWCRRGSR